MTKAEYLDIAASRYEELEVLKAKDNFYLRKIIRSNMAGFRALVFGKFIEQEVFNKRPTKKKRLPNSEK
ncbi:MAG: hypothetical protein LBE04_04780 [Prevotellaceae bacterium]|jgi:hypothetical protein|nr:hypothetical protein [Prevotellaceae bacterium]